MTIATRGSGGARADRQPTRREPTPLGANAARRAQSASSVRRPAAVSRSGTAAATTAARRAAGARVVRPRTQESVAVSADGDAWFLLNASPEIRAQIESFPAL